MRECKNGLLLVILFTPLFFLRGSQDVFLIPKETVSQILLFAIVCAWLVKSIKKGSFELTGSILYKPIVAFIFLAIVSVFLNPNPYPGFRELYIILSYGISFFLSLNVLKGGRDTDRIITAMIFAGAVSSVYGILQYCGHDFFTWIERQGPRKKVFSTHGNVHFLAGYLAVILPISLSRLLSACSKKRKIFIGISFILMYACLTLTYSRGAWLSLCFAFLFMFFLLIRRKFHRPVIKCFIAISCLFLFVLCSLSLSIIISRGKDNMKGLMLSLLDRRTEAIAGRELIWKSSLGMIRDYPLSGIGLGKFKLKYMDYLSDFLSDEKNSSYLAHASAKLRAHNDYLQVLVEMGPAGLLALLWGAGSIVFLSLSLNRVEGQSYPLACGLLAGMVGAGLHAVTFFPFHIIAIGIYFFIILGMFANQTGGEEPRIKKLSFKGKVSLERWLNFSVFIGFIFLSLPPAKLLVSDIYYRRGLLHLRESHYEEARLQFLKALSFDKKRGELHYELGYINFIKGEYNEAICEFETSLQTVNSEFIHFHLGNAYAGKGLLNKAASCYRKALSIEPDFGPALINLGNIYAIYGMEEEANKLYEKASYHEKTEIEARLNLARYFLKKGKKDEALRLFREAIEITGGGNNVERESTNTRSTE